jgi:drug/metabolite transporter (DMT)-like permease
MLSGLLWGSSFVVVKLGLRAIDPYWFVFMRFALASGIAIGYVAAIRRLAGFRAALRHPLVIWLGVTNAVGFVMQFKGQTLTTASKAALFVNSNTILVAVASWFVFRERLTRLKTAAIVSGMVGVIMVTTGGRLRLIPGAELTGDALIFGAAIIWTAFVLLNKKIVSEHIADVRVLTAAMVTVTALTALPLAAVFGKGGLPELSMDLWAVAYTALFCTVLPFLLWTWGLKHISATGSCVILLVEIVFALALATAVLGEHLSAGATLGAVLIVAAVILTSLEGGDETVTGPDVVPEYAVEEEKELS